MTNVEIQRQRRAEILDAMGGCCVKCGSIENLQIDHINPETKSFNLSGSFLQFKLEVVNAEIEKCQLLCPPCHWDKTAKDRNLERLAHPSLSAYNNRGCRCTGCKKANAEWQLQYARRRDKLKSSL